ncbi:hypothetical protein [Hymenobacter psychrophilus]|uniref:PIN domain-containing protein n=1 Tax=Hymenobacter psychrophilus TaxID=651662 RepID=A0A1H3BC29_9BACT|nr:hypothetical protein [Hymenobacter psychrophilus]SDX39466.1 hypothetical protein SAMN04488069_101237 [Hymenobacter psychrophilus]
MHFLIDTNVPLVANGASAAGPRCVLAAVERLRQLQQHEILVLDDSFLILQEYHRKLSPSGQPGVGDAFLQWVLRNRANPQHCESVQLQPDAERGFAAFPDDPELADFDPSDRKFVATALTHPGRPVIVNATDTDWHHHREPLERNGIQLEFICPEEMVRQR